MAKNFRLFFFFFAFLCLSLSYTIILLMTQEEYILSKSYRFSVFSRSGWVLYIKFRSKPRELSSKLEIQDPKILIQEKWTLLLELGITFYSNSIEEEILKGEQRWNLREEFDVKEKSPQVGRMAQRKWFHKNLKSGGSQQNQTCWRKMRTEQTW